MNDEIVGEEVEQVMMMSQNCEVLRTFLEAEASTMTTERNIAGKMDIRKGDEQPRNTKFRERIAEKSNQRLVSNQSESFQP